MGYTQTNYMSYNKSNYINRVITATNNTTKNHIKWFNGLQSNEDHVKPILINCSVMACSLTLVEVRSMVQKKLSPISIGYS